LACSAFAAILCFSGCQSSCGSRPTRVTISRVILNLPRDLDEAVEQRDAIRRAVEVHIDESDTARFVSGNRDAEYVLHLTANVVGRNTPDGDEGRPVEIRLQPTVGPTLYRTVGRGLPLEDVVASVMTGFEDAWGVIEQERWLDTSADERLVSSLNHPDARVRDFVIQRLGERRSREAVGGLCARLTTEPHEELVLRTVGALVAIGDEQAVEPLIELTRQKDPHLVIQIVYALAQIGGRTAEGYLVTLASGHPIPAVQASAEEALAELEEKRARTAPEP